MPTLLLDADLLTRGLDMHPLQALREHGVTVAVMDPGGSAPIAGTESASAPERGPEPTIDRGHFAEQLRKHVPPVFFVGSDWSTVQMAESLGSRAVLVLDGRSVDQVLGEAESESKIIPIAADLTMAGHYLDAELLELARLGPFRFATPIPTVSPDASPGLSRSDLSRLFALVVLAGLTFALGVAYLLQEAYQSIAFPKALQWPLRFLTLQWIPQTLRGLMFLLIGIAIGLAVTRLLNRFRRFGRAPQP